MRKRAAIMSPQALLGGRPIGVEFLVELEHQAQYPFLAPAQQGQGAVRGHGAQRLAVGEVVAKLGAGDLLPLLDRRQQHAVVLQVRAQPAQQRRVLGELLGEDMARAFQRRLDVDDTLVGVQVLRRFDFRRQHRIGEQSLGQRTQSGLTCDLCLGAALGLVGQVEVFQAAAWSVRPRLRRAGPA